MSSIEAARLVSILLILIHVRLGGRCSYLDGKLLGPYHPRPSLSSQLEWACQVGKTAIIDNNVEGFLVELTKNYKRTLSESCRAYFTAVNCWIPIIQQSAFESRLQESSSGMDSDFTLLVLSCLLLSKAASKESDEAELSTIYQIVRAYLFLLHSSGSQTLEIVQAGLVVTIYEHMQAEWENSFETIEKTAQLFCNTTRHLSIVTSGDAVNPTTTLLNSRVWWAIFIVER